MRTERPGIEREFFRLMLLFVLTLVFSLAGQAQNQESSTGTNGGAPASSASPPPTTAPSDSTTPAGDTQERKSLKQKLKDQFGSGCTNLGPCWGSGQSGSKPSADPSDTGSLNSPPPRSSSAGPDESSSKDTKVDLSPPPGEEGYAPGSETAAGVQEMRPWDPHKAEKSIEIGDFYLRRKNYRAAASRYREALYWKDNDALAQFRLGQALEGLGQYAAACQSYDGYLKILPQGPLAGEAHQALARLQDKPDDPH
jgi:tetratricopeptide (TPR) repeat protein